MSFPFIDSVADLWRQLDETERLRLVLLLAARAECGGGSVLENLSEEPGCLECFLAQDLRRLAGRGAPEMLQRVISLVELHTLEEQVPWPERTQSRLFQ